MIAKLISIFKEIRGSISKDVYCRERHGKTEICKKPRRGKNRGRTAENIKFQNAVKEARRLLEDEAFRERATLLWREWNAQFPEDWEPAATEAMRRKMAHPYQTVLQYVIGQLMRAGSINHE